MVELVFEWVWVEMWVVCVVIVFVSKLVCCVVKLWELLEIGVEEVVLFIVVDFKLDFLVDNIFFVMSFLIIGVVGMFFFFVVGRVGGGIIEGLLWMLREIGGVIGGVDWLVVIWGCWLRLIGLDNCFLKFLFFVMLFLWLVFEEFMEDCLFMLCVGEVGEV